MSPFPFFIRTRWIAGAALLVLMYALAGFFLVPRLARSAIEDFITQRLERQVAIQELKFNPFTFAAEIAGFELKEADGRPLASFADLLVNVQLSTLWNRALTFAEIRLIEPAIDAVINADGSLNLAALVPQRSEPEPPTESAGLPSIRIGLLEVGNGRIGLEDNTRSTPFRATLTPIRFTLNDFRTEAEYQNAYRFAGTTQAGEQLEWSGQFSVQPLGSTGRFSVVALKASTLWAYMRDQVAFTLPSGNIDLAGTYSLAVDDSNLIGLDLELPQIRLSDLAIASAAAMGDSWITVPELVLADTRFTLGDRRLSIGKVSLNGARVTVWREADGTFNLSQLAGSTVEAPAATRTDTTSPWQAEIAAVEIRDAAIEATDRSIEPAAAFSFSPIAITLTDIKSDLAQPFAVSADIGINQSGRLQVNGSLRPESLLADFDIKLADFGIPALQSYIGQATAMTVGSGRFGLNGHVTYAAEPSRGQPRLKFTGTVDVADFASRDDFLNEDFLKFGLLSLSSIDYSMSPDRLTIRRILARDPYARVVVSPDAKLNVTQVLNSGAETNPENSGSDLQPTAYSLQPPSPAMPIRIDTVVVENGSANFADYSIEPSFATAIESLAGTVQGLSSNEATRAKVDLKGAVDRFSPVVIAGEVNLLSAALYTDIGMSFSNMELTTFNPYSGKFAGYNIARGKLTTELDYKVENRQLEAEHHIVLDQLEFGAATDSKDAVPLPIKLAVALLKDRNGVIDLDLPVRGSLDDPTFKLGPIIWKAVVGLLTKIVTAPFALLGSLFGGGEDLAFVDFAPGLAQLPPESAARLATLTRALTERPQLKLDIPLNVTTPLDAQAIARDTLAQNVLTPATPAPDELGQLQQRLQALTLAHTRLVGTPPALPVPAGTPPSAPTPELLRTRIDTVEKALLAQLAPTPIQLETLARSRAEAVQGALLGSGEIAPERVFLTTRELAAQSDGVVRMELKLE